DVRRRTALAILTFAASLLRHRRNSSSPQPSSFIPARTIRSAIASSGGASGSVLTFDTFAEQIGDVSPSPHLQTARNPFQTYRRALPHCPGHPYFRRIALTAPPQSFLAPAKFLHSSSHNPFRHCLIPPTPPLRPVML